MANIWPRLCRQCKELYFGGARTVYCVNCLDERKKASRKKSAARRRQGKTANPQNES